MVTVVRGFKEAQGLYICVWFSKDCTYLTLVVRIVIGIKGIPFDCKTFKNSLGVVEMFVL